MTFFPALLPMQPMRAILLRSIRFSCSALLTRATVSVGRGSPDQNLLSSEGQHGGSQNQNGAVGQAEPAQATGAAKAPKHRYG